MPFETEFIDVPHPLDATTIGLVKVEARITFKTEEKTMVASWRAIWDSGWFSFNPEITKWLILARVSKIRVVLFTVLAGYGTHQPASHLRIQR